MIFDLIRKSMEKCQFISYRPVVESFYAYVVTKENLLVNSYEIIKICEEEKNSTFLEHDSLNSQLTNQTFHVLTESVDEFNNLCIKG